MAVKGPERWPWFTTQGTRSQWDEVDEGQCLHWCPEGFAYALQPSLGGLVVFNVLKRKEQPGQSDILHGEHLQLNEDVITFGLLYDYPKLYIVPRVAVIPRGDRATVEARRIPSVFVDTLDLLCAVPMTIIVWSRGQKWASL